MSDDIYSDILWRLRIPLPYELRGLTVQDIANERKDAADEIELLRSRLNEIVWAVINEGKVPTYHRAIVKKHRKEWPYLWKQIDKAVKVMRNE